MRGCDFLRRKGCSEDHGNPRPESPEGLAHRFPILSAEKASPKTVKGYRDNGDRCSPDNPFDSRPKLPLIPVSCEPSLREETHQLPPPQFLGNGLEGSIENPRILPDPGYGDDFGILENASGKGYLEELVVHDEANGPGAGTGDDQPVHEAHMVRYEKRRAAGRNVFPSDDLHSIHDVGDHPADDAEQELRDD